MNKEQILAALKQLGSDLGRVIIILIGAAGIFVTCFFILFILLLFF